MTIDDGLSHLPLEGLTASWAAVSTDPDHPSAVERLLVHFENEAWTVEGVVDAPATHGGFHYVVRFSATWHVQQMLLFRDLDEPDLWLATDGRGAWGEVNGAQRRELGGCADIDIRCSAFTRTCAVRRLAVPIGASTDVDSIVVDPDTLSISRSRLNYTRLGPRRWSVHRDDGLAIHEFQVDDLGLPLDIPGHFVRLT